MAQYVDLTRLGVTWPQQAKSKFRRLGLCPRDNKGFSFVKSAGLVVTHLHSAKAATLADVELILDTAAQDADGFCFAEISECTIHYAGRDSMPYWANYRTWPLVGDINPKRANKDGHVRGYALSIYGLTPSPDKVLQFLGLLADE